MVFTSFSPHTVGGGTFLSESSCEPHILLNEISNDPENDYHILFSLRLSPLFCFLIPFMSPSPRHTKHTNNRRVFGFFSFTCTLYRTSNIWQYLKILALIFVSTLWAILGSVIDERYPIYSKKNGITTIPLMT